MNSVFFTGHRKLENDKETIRKLMTALKKLILEGATDFYAGGAQGWDMLCEKAVLIMREDHVPHIKLHLILPCPPEYQIAKWLCIVHIQEYYRILEAADSVEIVSEHYSKDCMKKRNARLAELGDICVCYYDEKQQRSGTAQTVRMAKNLGKQIMNIK